MDILQRRPDGSHGRLAAGTRHMVAAGHAAAAQAGLLILEAGGNAVDAGVAAGLVLAVVQTDIVNFGGVAPIMIRSGKTGEAVTIDGLGVWPAKASSAYFRERHGGAIPAGVLRSVTPAAPAAWIEALSRYGTMGFADVAASAIRLASEGFPVHPTMADFIAANVANYQQFAQNAALYLPGGKPLQLGAIFKQPALAATLQHLADEDRAGAVNGREAGLKKARDAFYKGESARLIAAYHAENGGWMTRDDLGSYEVSLAPPVRTRWRNVEVMTCGPWCQGPVLNQTLAILGDEDLKALGHNSVAYIHLVAEAINLAFADREACYGDPRFVDVPLDRLLSDVYGREQRRRIDPRRAIAGLPDSGIAAKAGFSSHPRSMDAPAPSPDTSYVAVVDRWGNAFSATPSDSSFDSPLIPGTGIVASGRGSQSFTRAGHPSEVGPGRRPRLTPNPAMAIIDGDTVMPFGTPGGDVQSQAMLQFLLNLTVFDMDAVSAVEAPRFATYSFANSFEPHTVLPNRLMVEGRIGAESIAELKALGHDALAWPDFTAANGSICAVIYHEPSGLKIAAADPRRNTGMAGW